MQALAEDDPVGAKLVELKFFAGLSLRQAADTLGVPRRTADRHWAYARAWLFDRLGGEDRIERFVYREEFSEKSVAHFRRVLRALSYGPNLTGAEPMSEVTPDAKAIFFEALEQSGPEALAEFLDRRCRAIAEIRQRVEELLRAHQKAGQFLGGESKVGETVDVPPSTEQPGREIGPYKLLQQIGEGGMGTVFMAQQTRPVTRRVALKIIKPGMDSKAVIARFEAERQALAMMDHPNIAKVLDAGTTESGRPYFVMELVKGVPITEYCDKQSDCRCAKDFRCSWMSAKPSSTPIKKGSFTAT